MKTKIFIIAARIVLPLAAAALSVYLLWRYEFFVSPMDIDNIIGAIRSRSSYCSPQVLQRSYGCDRQCGSFR